jgi:hypothetical protein
MFAADFASNPGSLVSELAQVYRMGDNDICAIGNTSIGTARPERLFAMILFCESSGWNRSLAMGGMKKNP